MNTLEVPNLNVNINHRNWREALKECFAFLTYAQPGEVVCLVGPSRAGKSCMIARLCKLLVGEQNIDHSGITHSVVVTATNSGPHGSFSTKSFTLRMLEALKHPMYSYHDDNPDTTQTITRIERATEHALRQAVERGFKSRQVKYLFIDEAQHILYSYKRTQAAEAILDSWKCLAQDAGLVLVLVGAYPLLNVIQNSPHLLGRKHQVHMPRYQSTNEDLQQFAAIVAKYEQILSSICPSNLLLDNLELIYKHSLGCIGLLKLWLLRALAKAQCGGSDISLSTLQSTKLSLEELGNIEREIIAGENLLLDGIVMPPPVIQANRRKPTAKPFKSKPTRRSKNNRGGNL